MKRYCLQEDGYGECPDCGVAAYSIEECPDLKCIEDHYYKVEKDNVLL